MPVIVGQATNQVQNMAPRQQRPLTAMPRGIPVQAAHRLRRQEANTT